MPTAPKPRARRSAAAAPVPPPDAPDPRLHLLNDAPVNTRGAYVLYWCRANRRAEDNLALDHAVARANALRLPVLVYESLDPRYPHASDRIHTFVLAGVAAMRAALAQRGIAYAFYLPRTRDEAHASHALARTAARAALVVTDWYPALGAASSLWTRSALTARALSCRVEAYDDLAVVPLGLFQRREHAARTIRPRVVAMLPACLGAPADLAPRARPPAELELPFAPLEPSATASIPALVRACEIDHGVAPVAGLPGGTPAARARLRAFIARDLPRYADERNDLAHDRGSRLSPYLHFGQISPREMARAAEASDAPDAARAAFLEQLVVRRALAFNHAMTDPACGTWAAAPAWARATLTAHAGDPRADLSFAAWESAATTDALWNAAQRELLRDGSIHPYARMLWGKVALTLCVSPAQAFAWLVHLNDRYALDGRDPSGYTNIAWCFGLHDMPFPERAVYGRVRSMTSRAAERKWDAAAYVARVTAPAP